MTAISPNPGGQRNVRARVVVLCDQTVETHFPAHFHEVYLRLMAKHGYPATVFAFCRDPQSPRAKEMAALGLRLLQRRAEFNLPQRLVFSLGLARRLSVLFATDPQMSGAETYVVHNDPLLALVAFSFAKLRGRKFVYRITHLLAEQHLASRHRSKRVMARVAYGLRNMLMRGADQIVPMSPSMSAYFYEHLGIPEDRLLPCESMIAPEIPLDAQSASACAQAAADLRARMAQSGNKVWMIYLGSLEPGRELTFLVDVLEEARKLRPDMGLLVLGVQNKPAHLEPLVAYARERGLARAILWEPPVPEAWLPSIAALADVGLSPYPDTPVFRHNSPLKTLEYMRAGIPVVATPIDDNVRVLSASQAGSVADAKPAAFAAAVLGLIAEPAGIRAARVEKARIWLANNRTLDHACAVMIEAIERAGKA